jgi:chromosome segregation protein
MRREISARETALGKLAEQTEELRRRITAITEEKLMLEADRNRRDKLMQDKNQELLTLERECARLEQKKLAAEWKKSRLSTGCGTRMR